MKTFFQQFFGALTVIGLVIGMPYLLGILPTVINNKYILGPIIIFSSFFTIGLIWFIVEEEYAHPVLFYLSVVIVVIYKTFHVILL